MRALAPDIGERVGVVGVELDPEHVLVLDRLQQLHIAFGLGVEVEVEQQVHVRPGAVAEGFEMRLEIAQKQEAATNTQVVNVVPQNSTNDTRNRLESWYTNWGLGYPVIQYPDELGAVLDALKDIGVSNTAVMLDLLGFYFPIGEKVIMGSNLNAWGDRYESNGESIQINAFTFGGSAMFFLQERIGEGVFLRSDLGLSRLVLASSGNDTESSDIGVGFLIGGGYGIPVSRETRILIHLNYSIRSIESETYSNLGISVSGLF